MLPTQSMIRAFAVLFLSFFFCQPANADAAGSAPPSGGNYWAYIGTFTSAGKSKGIYRMEFNANSGTLSEAKLISEAPSPSFLAIAPNHRFLYSTNEVDSLDGRKEGAVSAYSLDPQTGEIAFLNRQFSLGRSPTHISLDPQGKNLLTANYTTGSVAVFPIGPDGKLAANSSVDQHMGKGADPSRQEGPHAHCVNIDPSGRFALSCDLGLDKLFIYQFNADKGTITPNDPPFATVAPGSGPRHMAFHANGKWVYVVNEMACTITAFSWDADHGSLSEIQTIATLPADFKGQKSTAEITVDRQGKFLYASNRDDANSIAIFSIDSDRGSLQLLGSVSTQGRAPRYFSLDPTGNWLLAENQTTDNVVVFQVDHATGMLKATGTNVHVPTPVCVMFLEMPR